MYLSSIFCLMIMCVVCAQEKKDGVCYTKIVKGKIVRVGDCEEEKGDPQMIKDIRRRIAQRQAKNNCDVKYHSKCFRAIEHSTIYNINITAAQKICNDMGWGLANIYDVIHYRLLENYVRPMIPSNFVWSGLWTGMSYKNNKLHLTSGSEVILDGVWFPGFPSSDTSRTNIVVHINKDQASKNQGIINLPPSYSYRGVMCEI